MIKEKEAINIFKVLAEKSADVAINKGWKVVGGVEFQLARIALMHSEYNFQFQEE